jgi:hypothetical protein
MSQRVCEPLKTFPVTGALGKYLRVKLSAGVLALAGSTDVELGVMEMPTFSTDTFGTVHLRTAEGTEKFVAVDAITAGNPFYAAASGKVSASGTVLIGIALETTIADGDVFEGLRREESSDSSASGGTTASAFKVDSDSTIPKIELASQTGGTGDYKVTIKPAATLTADRVVTIPDAATQVMVGDTATQTLTNKTLTAPVITDLTETVTATNVLTAAESGKTMFLSSATEFVTTLPAPAAGLRFRFIVAAAPSGASYTIVTNSSANIIKGLGLSSDLNAASDVDFETSGCDTISFVDSKSVAGDCVDLDCDGTNWFARAFCTAFDAITFTTAS